jgi:hypothetical protein
VVDEFLTPIRELIESHKSAVEAASRASKALRNHPQQEDLHQRLSKAHARLTAEQAKLEKILSLAKQAETAAAMNELNSLEAMMPAPGAELGSIPGLDDIEVMPQPEDVGFDIDMDMDMDMDVDVDVAAAPAEPATKPQASSASAPKIDGLDDMLAAFVGGGAPATADPAPAASSGGGPKVAGLDDMLAAFLDDDPFAGKRVRGNAKLRGYECNGLEEVQLRGLLTHAPHTLAELVKLSNLPEQRVRTVVGAFKDLGLVVFEKV